MNEEQKQPDMNPIGSKMPVGINIATMMMLVCGAALTFLFSLICQFGV